MNEEFVSDLIRSYLFSDPDNIPVLNNKKDVVDNFVGTLLYYFKYREYSAKILRLCYWHLRRAGDISIPWIINNSSKSCG